MTKHTSGHVFKRGRNFYCRWAFRDKVFSKALRDEQGNSITDRRAAVEAQGKLMAMFTAANETTALQNIADKLDGRKGELARLDEKENPAIAIEKAWPAYLAAQNRRDTGESTLRQYEFQFAAFARWMKEHHPAATTLRDVTGAIAEDFIGSLNHGRLSANTGNKYLTLLKMVFNVLKKKGRLTVNPWEEIRHKSITPHSRRELTVEELRHVCQSASGEMRALLAIGLYTGLRLGDCATLRWGEVDLARNIIRRIPNKTARRAPKPVIIPIHPDLRAMLAATAPEHGEYVLPKTAKDYRHRSNIVTEAIQAHFAACGITTNKPGTGIDGKRAVVEVGFHSLRHTFISICRESNVPSAIVESIVGHSSPAMTRHYTHIGELAAGQAVAMLPSVMGGTDKVAPVAGLGARMAQARALVESATVETFQESKAAILALLV